MKTINLLLLTILVSAMSMPSCSAQKKKDNYLFDSYFYLLHKKTELTALNKKGKKLMQQVRKGDKAAEVKMKELSTQKKSTNAAINQSNTQINKAKKLSLKIGPLPPCPPVNECNNDRLSGMIFPSNVKAKAWVYDTNKKLIGTLHTKPFSVDKKNGLATYDFKWSKSYKGKAELKVERTLSNNKKETYTIPLKF